MKRYFKFMILAVAAALVTVACTREEPQPVDVPDEEDSIILAPQPTTDEIKTSFHGKGFYGTVEDSLIELYLKPRIQQQVDSVNDVEIDFVLMSETYAEEVLNNEALFECLRALWNKQRAIGFIHPGRYSIELLGKLRNQSFDFETTITDDTVADFSGIKLYVTIAGIKNYVIEDYALPRSLLTESTIYSEDDSEQIESSKTEMDVAMNGYHLGLIAEDLCAWLNSNVTIGAGSDPALVSTRSGEEYAYGYSETQWTQNLSISYDEISEYNDPTFSRRTISAKTKVKVTAGYDASDNSDIYDVELIDKFPISQLYYQNYLLSTYGIVNYKDKFTGYCYTGPNVELSMKDASGQVISNGIGIYSASPQIDNETLSTTHYPMTASFGSSLSGGISAEDPSLSAGLSSSFTLPYEATTYAYKEMKFNYSESSSASKWEYYHDGYWIYDWTKGFNGSFENVYGPAKNDSDFSFMLTFKLNDSRSYGEQNIYLNGNIGYEVYSEVCTPKKHVRHRKYWKPQNHSFLMPIVYRYFGNYTPSYYAATVSATDDDWVNLKSMLEDNPTYYALSDEYILVGARVETTSDGRKGTEVQAERIWEETMNSIIQQRDGHTYVDGEWVIGLYGEGSWLKKGLHIKGNEWTIVEDVTAYADLRPAE